MNMRKIKKELRIGNKILGGNNPILIQTMANIKTSKIDEVLKLIEDCKKLGNNLMRLSILDPTDYESFKILTKKTDVPLIADIHFNYEYAINAIKNGASAIRINPGNIRNIEHLKEIIKVAKEYNIPIRIGVNSGSLPLKYKKDKHLASSLINSLDEYVKLFEENDFKNLVLSLKSSDPLLTLEAYRLANEKYDYPLHIGVTEAGGGYIGAIRSSVALVPLLLEGIGDTIRISLTEAPQDEVICCKNLLSALNLRKNVPTLVSCPTCGRTQVNLFKIYNIINEKIKYINKPIKIAVMGCIVNGPGEAKDADIGIAGGKNEFLIFKKGQVIKTCPEKEALEFLLNEIDKF